MYLTIKCYKLHLHDIKYLKFKDKNALSKTYGLLL